MINAFMFIVFKLQVIENVLTILAVKYRPFHPLSAKYLAIDHQAEAPKLADCL